jgi:osmotically-inducible protein OsmY
LKEHAATRDINITINARQGQVALRGIVLNTEERAQTESVAAAVPGVHSVDNQLRLMTSSRLFASSKQT